MDSPPTSQKTVRNGRSCGVVTYSNPDDAAKAMANLFVDLVDTREVSETHRDKRSEYPHDQSSCLPQDRFRGLPPQGLPCQDFWKPLYKQVMSHLNSWKILSVLIFFCVVVDFSVTIGQFKYFGFFLVSVCQHVRLHIHNFPKLPYQRKHVYSFLPQSTINVKVIHISASNDNSYLNESITPIIYTLSFIDLSQGDVWNIGDALCCTKMWFNIIINPQVEKRSALVTLPDYYTAFWVMDHLNGYYIGSKRLCVSFATERLGTLSHTLSLGHRKPHDCHNNI